MRDKLSDYNLTEKIAYKLLLFETSQPQFKLGSFKDRARITRTNLNRIRLARAKLARIESELSHEPEQP
jgi:hypothetical protein